MIGIGLGRRLRMGVSLYACLVAVTPAPAPLVQYGPTTGFDAGTSFDFYVDGTVSSSGDGTSLATAFKTIEEGLAAASTDSISEEAEKTVGVRDTVVWRQTLDVSPYDGFSNTDRVILSSYSTDNPKISGANLLTGWTQCTIADEPVVGANYASIYKASIPSGDKPTFDLSALNIYENDQPVPLAFDRADATEPFFHRNSAQWHVADSVGTSGGAIVSYTDPSVFSQYTEAQMLNARLYIMRAPNVTDIVNVTAFNTGTNVATVDGSEVYESNQYNDSYSLVNIPNMVTGRYLYVEEGDGSVTIYLRPNDVANLTAGIEYSARRVGISRGGSNNFTVRGFTIVQQAGETYREACAVGGENAGTRTANWTIEECTFGRSFHANVGYGGLYFNGVDNVLVQKCRGEYLVSNYPVFFQRVSHSKIWHNDFQYCERSNLRMYGNGGTSGDICQNIIYAYNRHRQGEREPHGNKFEVYEGILNFLCWGNIWEDCYGYGAHQEASGIFVAFNRMPQGGRDSTDYRAYDDQQHPDDTGPSTTGNHHFFNNTAVPSALSKAGGNAFQLGSSLDDQVTNMANNLVHGGGQTSGVPSANYGFQKNNVWTAPATSLDPTDYEVDPAEVYTDYDGDDFSLKDQGPHRNAGYDMSSVITTLAAIFTDFDFTKDGDGNTIDWSNPFIGAVKPSNWPAVPSTFGDDDWTVYDTMDGGEISFTVSKPPYNNGKAVSAIQFTFDGGSTFETASDLTTWTKTGLTDDEALSVQIRSVNAIGPGEWSVAKLVTPTTSVFAEHFVTFDGTNDYLTTAALTGAADSKKFFAIVVVDFANASGVSEEIWTIDGSTYIRRTSTGYVRFAIQTTSGTLSLFSSTACCTAAGRYVLVASVDTDNFAHLYVKAGAGAWVQERSLTVAGETIDWTKSGGSLGATAAGANKLSADVAFIGVWSAASPDLTADSGAALDFIIDPVGNVLTDPDDLIAAYGTPVDMWGGYQTADERLGNASQGWNDGYNQGSRSGTWTVNGAVTE